MNKTLLSPRINGTAKLVLKSSLFTSRSTVPLPPIRHYRTTIISGWKNHGPLPPPPLPLVALSGARQTEPTLLYPNQFAVNDELTSRLRMLTLAQVNYEIGITKQQRLPIGIPINQSSIPYESPTNSKNTPPISEIPTGKIIEDQPNQSNQIEKHAARLVVIRRIKMNKHKLKKLRKRMKYVWAKLKLRRTIKKEKIFLNEQMDKIRAAQKFDAKEYVASILQQAKHVPEPTHWNFEWLPQDMIREKLNAKLKREQEEYLSILDKRDGKKKF